MRNLRTEKEIVAKWEGNRKCVVSVFCPTYNHETCIEDAIEGFLKQETNFPFEVILHDDASTDRTSKIVEEYAAAYPIILKPIYQSINQYSQDMHLPFKIMAAKAKGEYIACCEGDDFWLLSNKLQTQVDLMRKFGGVDICFHACRLVNGHTSPSKKIFGEYAKTLKIFSTQEVVLGGGGFMPTASIVFSQTCLNKIINFLDQNKPPVGDVYIQALGSIKGGALFFPDAASCYRVNTTYSWSFGQRKISRESLTTQALSQEKCLRSLLEYGVSDVAVKQALAREMASISMVAFRRKYFDISRYYILLSKKYAKLKGFKQIVLSLFQFFPNFWWYLYRISVFVTQKMEIK